MKKKELHKDYGKPLIRNRKVSSYLQIHVFVFYVNFSNMNIKVLPNRCNPLFTSTKISIC